MRKFRGVAVGVGGLVLLSGCGASSFAEEPPADITKAATEDMKAISSLRMTGDIKTQGQEISLDIGLTTDGDCSGSVGLMGGNAEIVSLGGESWFKPDEAFWRGSASEQADQIMTVVGDNWVVLPPEQSDFTSFCDLDGLLDELESGDEKDLETDGTEEVDGQEAVILTGKTDEGDPIKAWVAVDGEHYILKMEVTQGEEPGTIAFSDFDEDLDIEAPPEDEVIDLSQLAG